MRSRSTGASDDRSLGLIGYPAKPRKTLELMRLASQNAAITRTSASVCQVE